MDDDIRTVDCGNSGVENSDVLILEAEVGIESRTKGDVKQNLRFIQFVNVLHNNLNEERAIEVRFTVDHSEDIPS